MKKSKFRQVLSQIYEIKLGKCLSVSIWLIPVTVFSFLGGYQNMFIVAYIAAILHELAHILCARLLNVKVSRIILYPFGVTARLSAGYIKNSEKEFLIAFAGPLLSIALFWLSLILKKQSDSDLLGFFADVNLSIALINLIPALPLDGGRMLKAQLTTKYGIIRSYNAMISLSRVLIALIGMIAIYIFFASGFNFSLILISAFLFQNLGSEQLALSHIAIREILENKHKVENPRPINTKTLCVVESAFASSVFKHLSYDYFCIFHILDKNAHLVKILTETEIIKELSENGILAKFSDIKS